MSDEPTGTDQPSDTEQSSTGQSGTEQSGVGQSSVGQSDERSDMPIAQSPMPISPLTLAIDVGGTGLKAAVLDGQGRMVADRVRVPTTYPLSPESFLDAIAGLVKPLPAYDRIAVGFPGVVRRGAVLTAPHFVTESGPGSPTVPALLSAWTGFAMADELSLRLGHPVRVANDADLQGLAVIAGKGLELVVTLGTGVGTGVFLDGNVAPHLELAHSPFRKGQTYNEQLGDSTLKRVGVSKWRKRLVEALENFDVLLNFDSCYIGGGNARHAAGHVDPSYKIIDNVAGILGGIKLWDEGSNHSI